MRTNQLVARCWLLDYERRMKAAFFLSLFLLGIFMKRKGKEVLCVLEISNEITVCIRVCVCLCILLAVEE